MSYGFFLPVISTRAHRDASRYKCIVIFPPVPRSTIPRTVQWDMPSDFDSCSHALSMVAVVSTMDEHEVDGTYTTTHTISGTRLSAFTSLNAVQNRLPISFKLRQFGLKIGWSMYSSGSWGTSAGELTASDSVVAIRTTLGQYKS